MSRILESLNDRQREAVQATEGYFRIIAGAGSGKTKTLTHRFAYLVQEIGVPSNRILCVTFTNKAAAEMRGRVKQLLGENITDEYICTFHSFCVKVLRREIQRLGYQQTFSILDMTDQKSLIKEVFEEMGLSSNDGITAKDALKHIEMCKTGEGWEHVVKLLVAPNDPVIPAEAEVKDRILLNYLTLQRKNLSLDFNDLISFTLYLLQTNHQVLDTWSNAFSYIMVDETQDNSRRQWAMLELLAKACRNLFVVGDPDQAIYSFRGARPEGLVKFDKVFSPCTTIVLDQNYRSTPTILGAANDIIVHNRLRVKKELYTDNVDPGSPIEWIHADNDKNESLYVASKVQSLLENGAKSDDIAVLFRVSALSRSVEQAFIQNGIKYQVFGGMRFFERKEIKDVMAYLTMAETPDNDMAFLRTYNYPSRKLGKAFINRIKELAKADGSSYFAALLKHYGSVKEVTRSGAAEYIKLANQIQGLKGGSISDLATYILDQTGIMKELRESEDTERLDNVVELQNSILSYENEHKDDEDFSLKTYLQDISLYTNVDAKDKEDSIKLMTIHQSKGLEFPYVFLIGMEEGVFPSEMSKYSEADLEEERRLAYVGITRAKKELYISNSVSRMLYGRTQRNEPSRFLREIEPEYIEETRSPALERRSSMGWGSSYSDTVPGGASGYSGASGWGRNSSSFGGRTGGSYLNREYNASERGGFGSGYAGRGSSASGFGSGSSAPRASGSSGFGVGYGRPAAPKAASKPVSFPGSPAASRPASTGPKHYEVGDIVEHKVFGRGRVLAVKAAAGDQIVEINFEKVGVKKTMANFAPLTKITEE